MTSMMQGSITDLSTQPSLWPSYRPNRAEHFTSGAGGYFAGLLRKAERGELRLERNPSGR
jgi:hypothetical protein